MGNPINPPEWEGMTEGFEHCSRRKPNNKPSLEDS